MGFLKSELAQKLLSGGSLSIVRIITGLIRVKILALFLGPSGMGLIAQVNQFYLFCISVMTLNMAVGIINRTRKPDRIDNLKAKLETQGAAILLIAILTLVVAMALLLFKGTLIETFFGDHLETKFYLLILLSLPFEALATGYFEGIFFSRDRFDLYVKAAIVTAFLDLAVTVLLVTTFGLNGAFMSIAFSGPVMLIVFFIYALRLKEPLKNIISFSLNWGEAWQVLKIGLSVMGGSAIGYFVVLWTRAEILTHLGTEKNGILQPVVAFSAYTLPLIANGVWGHIHPKASKSGDTSEGRKELTSVLKIVVTVSAFIVISLIVFAKWLVWLAYSKDFSESSALFSYQMVGDFFFHIFFIWNAYLLSVSRLKIYFWTWLSYYGALYVLVLMLLEKYGVMAYSLSHMISSVCLGLVSLFWLIKTRVITLKVIFEWTTYLFIIIALALLQKINISIFYQIGLWLISALYLARNFLNHTHANEGAKG